MLLFVEPTAEEVRAERDRTGMGLIWSKKHLRRERAKAVLASTSDDLATRVEELTSVLRAALTGPMF